MDLLLKMAETETKFLDLAKSTPKKDLQKMFHGRGVSIKRMTTYATFVTMLVREIQVRYQYNTSVDSLIEYVEKIVKKNNRKYHEQYVCILTCLLDIKTKMIQRLKLQSYTQEEYIPVSDKSKLNASAIAFNPVSDKLKLNANAIAFNPEYDIKSTCTVDKCKLPDYHNVTSDYSNAIEGVMSEPPEYDELLMPPEYHVAINDYSSAIEGVITELPPPYEDPPEYCNVICDYLCVIEEVMSKL